MKLTKNCELLMSFFLNKNCINHVNQTTKTDNILKKLYKDVKNADEYINAQKRKDGDAFYKLNITKITNVSHIPKPKTFTSNSFPEEVIKHIDNSMLYDISYTFSLFDREIKVHFVVEDSNPEHKIELYNEYVETMLKWLYIVNEYASKSCSKKLAIFIYFTSLKKKLPSSNITILDENHVNTAFTYTCKVDSEIVVFRKVEWLKVFMHETIHNFAVDFSDMNTTECRDHILSIFKVKSDVNLYEAYTEFWAEIMNAVFCSYSLLKKEEGIKKEEEFLSNFEFFINFERTYKFFQIVKTLDFMGLTYKDLYSTGLQHEYKRDLLYKEKSNVLSYYIITAILMNNYQGFLSWCDTNNLALLQFKKTTSNLNGFCKFIEKNYKTRSMTESVDYMQKFMLRLYSDQHKHNNNNKNKNNNKNNKEKKIEADYILNNMRMTICELG